MSANDKRRVGESKKKNCKKYALNNRLNLNRISREVKNLRDNPNDFDALKRVQAITVPFPGKDEAIRDSVAQKTIMLENRERVREYRESQKV